ncbi:MAG: phosphatidylserine decarboxylase [Proteobacteria bacterium]|jgi:phosphatidylserine decarboxylase|nr:phosphatidylserine decarboxylase [Alphaproteobacteria bacterium]NCC02743.1 phosphatidylserine decarboxylase [Pseudomonadota bacterium]
MFMKSKGPIHEAGWPFIAIAALITLFLGLIFGQLGFIFGLIVTGWVIYFFRDPARVTPSKDGLVVSPADGRIQAIADVVPDKDLGLGDEPRTRVSIFLNVFDVHVNRSPVSGTVAYVHYRPGKFVNASLDKASVDNERNALAITMKGEHKYAGQKIGVVQIAGLIARRILCHVKPDDELLAGQRFGLIRFGSRTDIYLPAGVKPLVCIGQRAVGGETVIADMTSDEMQRVGEVR